jgi:hypothetical protein
MFRTTELPNFLRLSWVAAGSGTPFESPKSSWYPREVQNWEAKIAICQRFKKRNLFLHHRKKSVSPKLMKML